MRRKAAWMSLRVIIFWLRLRMQGLKHITLRRKLIPRRDAACRVSQDGASPVSAAKNGTKVSRGSAPKYNFRNGPLGQGLSPFETYASLEKPVRIGF